MRLVSLGVLIGVALVSLACGGGSERYDVREPSAPVLEQAKPPPTPADVVEPASPDAEPEEEPGSGCPMNLDGTDPILAAVQSNGTLTVTRTPGTIEERVVFTDGTVITLLAEACETLDQTWTMSPAGGSPWDAARVLENRLTVADPKRPTGVGQCLEGRNAEDEADEFSIDGVIRCSATRTGDSVRVDFTFGF